MAAAPGANPVLHTAGQAAASGRGSNNAAATGRQGSRYAAQEQQRQPEEEELYHQQAQSYHNDVDTSPLAQQQQQHQQDATTSKVDKPLDVPAAAALSDRILDNLVSVEVPIDNTTMHLSASTAAVAFPFLFMLSVLTLTPPSVD